MRAVRYYMVFLALAMCGVSTAFAIDEARSALLDPAASRIADRGAGLAIDLVFDRPVPYRAFLLADPPRLVLDLAEVEFGTVTPTDLDRATAVRTLNWGAIRAGWSRVVAELDGPYRIESAEQREKDGGGNLIHLRLAPSDPAEFAARVAEGAPASERWMLPEPAESAAPKTRQTGEAPLVVVLDPGHGGIDPGAEAGGVIEADVMLGFARELAGILRDGGIDVVLTRDEDGFVPLETRISIARAAGADIFLSLHADALQEGQATGSTIYLLADAANDTASRRLAERHDRADLLAGVDLAGQDDTVAFVMMDMARTETQPRSDRLAKELAEALSDAQIRMHPHPIQRAGFSVLKSPDIPSALLEIGFLSSPADRERLADPDWRGRMQAAILTALRTWAEADAAEARLIRQ